MQNASFSNLKTFDYLALREEFKPRFSVHVLPPPGSQMGIFLNVKRKPLDDPRIRKAMHLATDRQQIIKLVTSETVALPGTPFPPITWYGRSVEEVRSLPGYRQPKDPDIAEAKDLLTAAGMPKGFQTSMLVRTVGAEPDIAAVWKQQMSRIGIDVVLRALDSVAAGAAYVQGNFDSGVVQSAIAVDEPEAVIGDAYRVGAVRNYGCWINDDVERLTIKQRSELDRGRRAQVLRQLEDELLSWKNNYWIGLFWEPNLWIVHNRVGGFVPPTTGLTALKNEQYSLG